MMGGRWASLWGTKAGSLAQGLSGIGVHGRRVVEYMKVVRVEEHFTLYSIALTPFWLPSCCVINKLMGINAL